MSLEKVINMDDKKKSKMHIIGRKRKSNGRIKNNKINTIFNSRKLLELKCQNYLLKGHTTY